MRKRKTITQKQLEQAEFQKQFPILFDKSLRQKAIEERKALYPKPVPLNEIDLRNSKYAWAFARPEDVRPRQSFHSPYYRYYPRVFKAKEHKETYNGKYRVLFRAPHLTQRAVRTALWHLGFTWQQYVEAMLYALWTDGPSPLMSIFDVIETSKSLEKPDYQSPRYIFTYWDPIIYRRLCSTLERTGSHWRGNLANFLTSVWAWSWSPGRETARREGAALAITIENVSRIEVGNHLKFEYMEEKEPGPAGLVSPHSLLQKETVMCLPSLLSIFSLDAESPWSIIEKQREELHT